ncbi:MAG: archaetidylserine decarboxylase [Thiotrichales bacterium]|nr:archaetidylserine decarboxylase [Thiotrichales bacterium]MCY4349314.1 archaetidylserine decarboxylase [Thiotrichales bacterium]
MTRRRLTPATERTRAVRGADRLAGVRQRLYPKHLLSWMMLHATRFRFTPWKNWQIRWFIRRYGVDLSVVADPAPASYPHFNAFFTRALTPGARPLEGGRGTVVAPADGTIAAVGSMRGRNVVHAKNHTYGLRALFGGDEHAAAEFRNGRFVTIYLAPRDYHRVHMPITGRLRSMVYVPGELFSVNPATVDAIEGLFARNERVVSFFDTDIGPLAVTMVGAVFVGCIELAWCGVVTPPRRREALVEHYEDRKIVLEQGCELGRFNMGSTVITMLANPTVEWSPGLKQDASVETGRRIGEVRPAIAEHA